MNGMPLRALVVGDRFIRVELFVDALRSACSRRGVEIQIEQLSLHYPSADSLPLPASAQGAEFRPLWEDPNEVIRRASEDFEADPAIREYTGPVDMLVPHVRDIDALLVHAAPVSRRAVAAANRLRVVACARGGPVNINVASLSARNIPVINCPGRNARAVGEFLMGAILSLTRGIAEGSRSIAESQWRLDLYSYERTGFEVFGRTCGMVGFGMVGRAFAPIARGFGLRLLVHDPYVSDADLQASGAERCDLDEMLSRSDILIMAARLTNETRNMIGAREFGLLKPGAIFVNTARAELVDQQAFRDAVKEGRVTKAVVDVFMPEPPLEGDPLLNAPGVLLTPHIAGATQDAAKFGADHVADDVVEYLVDGVLNHCVNQAMIRRA